MKLDDQHESGIDPKRRGSFQLLDGDGGCSSVKVPGVRLPVDEARSTAWSPTAPTLRRLGDARELEESEIRLRRT
jgi:hypothetical protein